MRILQFAAETADEVSINWPLAAVLIAAIAAIGAVIWKFFDAVGKD